MADYLLLETGDRIVLEDGTGDVLLEQQGAIPIVTDPAPYQRRYVLNAQAEYRLDARRTYRRR